MQLFHLTTFVWLVLLNPSRSQEWKRVFINLLFYFLFFHCREPLINCCPVCGEILEVSDKLNTMIHLTLCFDEGTGNQVMTGGFLTDKQASYGWVDDSSWMLGFWFSYIYYNVPLPSIFMDDFLFCDSNSKIIDFVGGCLN